MSPEQSRAARGWLDWSQDDLAAKAKVSVSTVRAFEKGRHSTTAANLDAMRRAIEAAGIILVFDDRGRARGIEAKLRSR
jgi:ribosome-binding protein aMBF1 (putative translation factor)